MGGELGALIYDTDANLQIVETLSCYELQMAPSACEHPCSTRDWQVMIEGYKLYSMCRL